FAVWLAFALSILPILSGWDTRLFPNEAGVADRIEHRNEAVQLRKIALAIRSSEKQPFVAPWWLSPSIAYWSGQAGMAGSSHESLPGMVETARLFLRDEQTQAREILRRRQAVWVFAYDSGGAAPNWAELLAEGRPSPPVSRVPD